jgi:hypothetical protein
MTHPAQQTIEDDRLSKLTLACPDCGATMHGTGRMYFNTTAKRWMVEYRCPADQEIHEIWTPETETLVQTLAK